MKPEPLDDFTVEIDPPRPSKFTLRLIDDTPITRKRPCCACGSTAATEAKATLTSPASTATAVCEPPLYGTCRNLVFDRCSINACARCKKLPMPAEP